MAWLTAAAAPCCQQYPDVFCNRIYFGVPFRQPPVCMNSSRPYIIRALYEWIVDNGCTPYLLVDANLEEVQVPTEYVENGKIVLNVSPSAVRELSFGNEDISFSARFGGTSRVLYFPVTAVLAVYARENGKGMMFSDDDGMQPPPEPAPASPSTKKPSLKVVK